MFFFSFDENILRGVGVYYGIIENHQQKKGDLWVYE